VTELNRTISLNQRNWAQDSYLSFFQEISKHILGYVEKRTVANYSWIDFSGRIKETNLALSRQWYDAIRNISTGILKESLMPSEPLVRNSTLIEDIEGFALNASLSLLNGPTIWYLFPDISSSTLTNVIHSDTIPANVASTFISTVVYKTASLWATYGSAIGLTLAASLVVHGVFPNRLGVFQWVSRVCRYFSKSP
jgi:hypothetical protein